MTNTTSTLPRSTPEAQGVTSDVLADLIDALDANAPGLHSVMLMRHGHVVAEGWWSPYEANRLHMLFSLSKSFTSTAAGFAVNEGLLSLDDRVVGFFPDDLPAEVSGNLAAMTVRDLLTMTAGHEQESLRALRERSTDDWVKSVLAQPVPHVPGTKFVYNSGATYMVSAILQKLTGQRVFDYLGRRLFEPLGIVGADWEVCPKGINTGGWGLRLKTEDIAKFGQLYLQDGIWNGQRLLPAGWVAEATSWHVSNGDNAESDWAQGYGYQFWRCRHNTYRGDGACGQFCLVMPEQAAVLAFTAGVGDMQGVLNLVWNNLLPAFGAAPLPDNPAAHERLISTLAGLRLVQPTGERTSPIALKVAGKTYQFDDNEPGLETAKFVFGDPHPVLCLQFVGRDEQRIVCGLGRKWIRGATTITAPGYNFPSGVTRPIAVNAAWTSDDTFAAKICFTETPFCPAATFRFEDDRVILDFRASVLLGATEWPRMVGHADKPAA